MYFLVPSSAPSVKLEARLSSINVTWDEMLPRERNGVIQSYKIFSRRKGGDFSVQIKDGIPATSKSYILQGRVMLLLKYRTCSNKGHCIARSSLRNSVGKVVTEWLYTVGF